MLYGSLCEHSYRRLMTYEAAHLLRSMGGGLSSDDHTTSLGTLLTTARRDVWSRREGLPPGRRLDARPPALRPHHVSPNEPKYLGNLRCSSFLVSLHMKPGNEVTQVIGEPPTKGRCKTARGHLAKQAHARLRLQPCLYPGPLLLWIGVNGLKALAFDQRLQIAASCMGDIQELPADGAHQSAPVCNSGALCLVKE